MPGHEAGSVPGGRAPKSSSSSSSSSSSRGYFRPQDLVGPNTLTGDLAGVRGLTLHKTIEDEDDDEYEDEKEVPRT